MNASDLRIVFAGTPEFAAAHLQAVGIVGHGRISLSLPSRAGARQR